MFLDLRPLVLLPFRPTSTHALQLLDGLLAAAPGPLAAALGPLARRAVLVGALGPEIVLTSPNPQIIQK